MIEREGGRVQQVEKMRWVMRVIGYDHGIDRFEIGGDGDRVTSVSNKPQTGKQENNNNKKHAHFSA
jgi:hypothetical protein